MHIVTMVLLEYLVSIAGGAVQFLGFPFFRETYAPILLQGRCKRSRKSTQNLDLYTQHDRVSFSQLPLRSSLIRSLIVVETQPIMQVWSLDAYLYGILHLLIATFSNV